MRTGIILVILGAIFNVFFTSDISLVAGFCFWIGVVMFLFAIACKGMDKGELSNALAFFDNNNIIYKTAYRNASDKTDVVLAAYVKEIVEYNKLLKWHSLYESHWFIGGFMCKCPATLKPIDVVPNVIEK